MNLPPHISKIGLFTGQMYLIGGIYHIYKSCDSSKKQTNLAIICLSVYATTMAHWYNIKSSGIAKTVDMITVVATALFVSFHESYKWNPIYRGREMWISVLLLGGVTYVVNTAILSVPLLPFIETERLQLITTIAHTFWLHVMPNLTVIWSVWCETA